MRVFPSQPKGNYIRLPFILPTENIFFNAYHFAETLFSYKEIEVICFSFHVALYKSLNISVKRLIYNKVFNNEILPPKIKAKQISNLHSKMFICYPHSGKPEVFLGSWNFSQPTYMELVIKVNKSEVKACINYFETLWNIA